MLETRALFIDLREALVRWNLCGIHIVRQGDMQEIHASGQHSKLAHTCVSKLERRSGGQICKRCGRHERCRKCEGSSHMCEHTLRLMRVIRKVIRMIKCD